MRHLKNRTVRWAGAIILLGAGVACHDILAVENPQAFTNDAANSDILLPAVAAGAEGDVQLAIDNMAIMSGMLSDEFWHTGTWSDWLDVSTGVIRMNPPFDGAFTDPENSMLRARGAAASASLRFERVMGDTAHKSPLFITSQMARAWADVELAMAVCQIPTMPGGPPVSDTVLFKQAADSFTALLPLISAAHYPKAEDRQARLNQANAGLARTNLMLGNYAAAMTSAQAVPAGFEYDAVYSANSDFQNNQMANQGNSNYNRSFSIRDIWFTYIDTVAGKMRDPYTGELDPRLLFSHDNNNVRGYDKGSDGVTRFFSVDKYPAYSSPIPISKSEEMNLIVAEVQWRQGNFSAAMSGMNMNRRAVGLSDLTLPTSGDVSTRIRDMLLQERFATLFGENSRLQDLYRFRLITQRLGPNRATKLPLSRTEQLTNPNIGVNKETCPARS